MVSLKDFWNFLGQLFSGSRFFFFPFFRGMRQVPLGFKFFSLFPDILPPGGFSGGTKPLCWVTFLSVGFGSPSSLGPPIRVWSSDLGNTLGLYSGVGLDFEGGPNHNKGCPQISGDCVVFG